MFALWDKAFEGIVRPDGSVITVVKRERSAAVPPPPSLIIPDDDESHTDDELQCQICCEPFDAARNPPYVLWCGHTLCKNCVSRLDHTVVKLRSLWAIPVPFFVSCPWCKSVSCRLSNKENFRFISKNFFVLSLMGSNGSKSNVQPLARDGRARGVRSEARGESDGQDSVCHAESCMACCGSFDVDRVLHVCLCKSLASYAKTMAKFALIVMIFAIVFQDFRVSSLTKPI